MRACLVVILIIVNLSACDLLNETKKNRDCSNVDGIATTKSSIGSVNQDNSDKYYYTCLPDCLSCCATASDLNSKIDKQQSDRNISNRNVSPPATEGKN
ncbi:hypothetical protein [Candidatus Nitrosacidococcus sp. I8]|uniref:hypothetical protein n=1 Tax=Candidatus Nitrosacidococcus sp. I8 TaxID=2942908 RepID=UPI0022266D60|nr:hypothetical protein [Candidatus Nitrosacidococcus sp. I8]CAH9018100.1 hypothetical protein NURINAE_00726 [Candidatus Nitrosacidococcus sp. I8]